MINEDFLYYIWKNKLLTQGELKCINGERISIVDPGYRNTESGPDFTNARIRIDDVTWAGNVEIHVKASDWHRHLHEKDQNYDNVILHAVFTSDKDIRRNDGSHIPTLEMNGKFPEKYLDYYTRFLRDGHPDTPCFFQIRSLPEIIRYSWIDRMISERLEIKFAVFSEIFDFQKKSWPASFYILMARTFGFKVNAGPFELLARNTPYKQLLRLNSEFENTEALIFGQSGLLTHAPDEPYTIRLKSKYHYFKSKSHLTPISAHLWKFGGLRPFNFPTLRISQFAQLFSNEDHLIDRVLSAVEIEDVIKILDISASDYWYMHYRFGQTSSPCVKKLGNDAIRNIIINAIIPFLFFYGKKQHLPLVCDKAIYWLEKCFPENNKVIRFWEDAGWQVLHAGESQGLLHMKQHYCDEKRCIACSIGQHLIRAGAEHCQN